MEDSLLKFFLRKRERGHSSARSVPDQFRNLALVAGSQAAIVGERRGPVSAGPALSMTSSAGLVESFFGLRGGRLRDCREHCYGQRKRNRQLSRNGQGCELLHC